MTELSPEEKPMTVHETGTTRDEIRQERRRGRNLAVLAALLALVVLIYLVTLVRMGGG